MGGVALGDELAFDTGGTVLDWHAGLIAAFAAWGDVIGNAVKVMRIATGEETEEVETDRAKSAAAELGA